MTWEKKNMSHSALKIEHNAENNHQCIELAAVRDKLANYLNYKGNIDPNDSQVDKTTYNLSIGSCSK